MRTVSLRSRMRLGCATSWTKWPLERFAPMLKRKGRVQAGADADLTLFDPATVIDRSTYEKPAVPSEGIRHVIVGGTPVVRDGRLLEGVLPGKPVRAPVR